MVFSSLKHHQCVLYHYFDDEDDDDDDDDDDKDEDNVDAAVHIPVLFLYNLALSSIKRANSDTSHSHGPAVI